MPVPIGAEAEDIAVAILTWLAGDPDLLSRFLALSGLTAQGLRAAAAQPGFAAGILEFVMGHEPTLMAFSAASGIAPERVAAAAARAGGPRALDSGEI